MLEPSSPSDEAARLTSLRDLHVLDTPPEDRFDRITRIAAAAFDTPIALVSLVDEDRQWFKSRYGPVSSQTPRAVSFCGHGILSDQPFIVSDAQSDPRFHDNPLVTGDPHVRFYAGVPLDDGSGHKLGMLCVIDNEPRLFSTDQAELLKELGSWAQEELLSIGLDRALSQHRETLDRLNILTESLIDGFIVLDSNGTLLAFNAAAERMFGQDRSCVLGQNAQILIANAQRPVYEHRLAELNREARGEHLLGFNQQATCLRASGATFPVELSISHTTADGSLLYLVIVRDITERWESERALRSSEERYRQLSDLAPIGIFKTDQWGRCLYTNRRWCEISGTSSCDKDHPTWFSGIHPDDAARIAMEWASTSMTHQTQSFEFRFQLPSGRITWVSARLVPQVDDNGQPSGFLGVINDITEQRQAEMALRTSEEIHRSVIDSMSEGIVIQDKQSRLVGCNASAERILGMSVDRILDWATPGDGWRALRDDGTPFPPEAHPSAVTLRTGESQSNVVMGIPQAGGEIRWILINSQPLTWEDESTPWGVSCAFADITGRQAVDRMKGEFISVVSHELRTPLTSIRGALGLLAGGALGKLDERPQRMLDIAVANTDRLGRLVSDILDIERIESGTVGLSRRSTDIAALVTQAIEVMGPMAHRAGVTLKARTSESPVLVDPDRIIQTLTNLISNAIKFSPSGSTITVRTASRRGVVTVEVEDQGRGIPPDKIETIFERFQQVDASDSRAKGGTGLGLAICRSIVEQHGGLIWARSRPGEGSTFSFSIPLMDEQEPTSRRHGPSILVFDDHHQTSVLLRGALESRGCLVAIPGTADQAMRVAKSRRPEAIVLDLDIPGLAGWEAVSAIRSTVTVRDISVILVGCHKAEIVHALNSALDVGRDTARALIIEGNQHLRGVLCDTLAERGIEIATAQHVENAFETLERFGPDLILIDLGSTDAGWEPFLNSIDERARCIVLAGTTPPHGSTGASAREEFPEVLVHRIVEFVVAFTRRSV